MKRILAVIPAALAAIALSGCKEEAKKAPAPQAMAVPVHTMKAKSADLPVALQFIARTESSRAVSINARVSGFLNSKPYAEGAYVREGDTLFEIDRKPFEAQVRQIEAALSQSEASWNTARINLKRLRPLAQAKAVSQSELDNAVGAEKAAAGLVEQNRARLEEARLQLSYATVKSPISGLAGSATQAEGTYISAANSNLTTVYALSPMWVTFSMSENQALELARDVREGRIRFPADGRLTVRVEKADGTFARDTGSMSFVSPAFDSRTGTFKLRASLPNNAAEGQEGGAGQLRPNQFVRVHLEGAVRPSAIAVPQRAVQQGAHGSYVWVVREGKAQMQPVSAGTWSGGLWHIPQGLKDGDEVVLDGVLKLAPGAAVRAMPAEK